MTRPTLEVTDILRVSMLGAPIVREDDSVEGAVVVVQDIDEIKRERERLLCLAEALIKELKSQTYPAHWEPIAS